MRVSVVEESTKRDERRTHRKRHHQPLPAWAERLDSLLAHGETEPGFAEKLLAADATPPFAQVFVPFVAAASAELRDRAGPALLRLSDAALLCCKKALLHQLCGLSVLTLNLEFRRYEALRDPIAMFRDASALRGPPWQGSDPQGVAYPLYREFLGELQAGRLAAILKEYAVLGRLLAIAVEHWIEHVAEFCLRLEKDLPELTRLFGADRDPGQVSDVGAALSDAHNRGRYVIALTFATGLELVYKPRNLAIDAAFFALVDWINERADRGAILPLRSLKVLNRGTHGWMEFADNAPLPDADAAGRYYRRVGMTLSLVHALDGIDFHLANVVASGEDPLLVDLETLLHAVMRPWDPEIADSADVQALRSIENSVLRSGLLPSSLPGGVGRSLDLSGFGGDDNALVAHQGLESIRAANVPRLDDRAVPARDYVTEICEGFASMYRFLMQRREELLASGGPLDAFRDLVVRHVLRATETYGTVARRSLYPEFLRDGADRSIELERLALVFAAVPHDQSNPALWGVLRAEIEALDRLDFPQFHVRSDGTDLLADGRLAAAGVFEQSGYERVRDRVRRLSVGDLSRQLGFIQAALHARWGRRTEAKAAEPPRDRAPLTSAELIAAAASLAAQIRSSAVRGPDGTVTWVSLCADFTTERLNPMPMGNDLYDGRLGVALFLAALEHVSGGAGYRDLALAALLPLKNTLRKPDGALARHGALGAAVGLGSHLYGLCRVGTWLGEAELVELAANLVDCFASKRIARDEALDVVAGAAGGILGFLALGRAGMSRPLEHAVHCGDHLLANRVSNGTGFRAWKVPFAERPLTGFAHGAAGISYALTLLGQASGEQRFVEAAHEGIAYEAAAWSAEAHNWPDYRVPPAETPAFMNAWCHGAAGIGLGRLGGLAVLDSPAIRADIEHGLAAVVSAPVDDVDHLCCGNFGRLDLLLEAGQRLRRPALTELARNRANAIIRRAGLDGHFLLRTHVPGFGASPSLFQGLAGIGYQLLRLAEPDRLPCVLLWQ